MTIQRLLKVVALILAILSQLVPFPDHMLAIAVVLHIIADLV